VKHLWAWSLVLFLVVVAFFTLWFPRLVRRRGFVPDGADEAMRLCWVVGYGEPWSTRPTVAWIVDGPRCAEGKGWTDLWGRCVAGQAYPERGHINLSWWKGAQLSETALVHECAHVILGRLGEDTADHSHPWFRPGGTVERVSRLLQERMG